MSTPTPVDLMIHASWIIPIIPQGRVFTDCALVAHKGEILAVGMADELKKQYQPQKETVLDGHALIPGLVNAHCHSAMTLLRGYADDKPLMEWLENHIWPAEQQWVSEQFVEDGSRLAIAEMLATGTTTFSDMYFFPEITASVALEAGIRTHLTFPILDFPTIWASDSDDYLRKGIALHDQYRAHDLINVGFGPHAPYTVSDTPLKKIATYAEELQSSVQIHLHETAHEVESAVKDLGQRPIQRMQALGLLSPLTQCVHMTQLDESDIELLSTSGAHVVHCPESNLKLASGLCPVNDLMNAGVNVCLGTDGAASNNDLDMLGEMQSAAMIGKITASDASALDATSALEMATINGAKALGIESQVGSLEPGKRADIAAIDLRGLSQRPIYNPVSQIVYTNVSHKVSNVWVDGKQLIEDYRHTSLDIQAVQKATQSWQEKISKSE